ncbi:MAG: GxxExxY protein [Thermoplasmatota archaeon]
MDEVTTDAETFAIIGAAIEVHRWFGPGYLEAAYHKAMAIELRLRGIQCRREVPFPLSYKGEDLGTAYRADLVCGDVLIELKATSGLADHDVAQVVHYLRSSGLRRGLLLNFGLPVLQKKRVVLDWTPPSADSALSAFAAPPGSQLTTPFELP